jgi:hypothetical protein
MALKRPLLTALFFCFSFLGLHFGAFAQETNQDIAQKTVEYSLVNLHTPYI